MTRIGGIMHSVDLAMVGVLAIPSQPGVAGRILSTMGEHDINVQFIVQTVNREGDQQVVFCVSREDLQAALSLLENIRQETSARDIVHQSPIGLVSIFGPDFRQRPGIAGQMFSALGFAGIDIKAISTSTSTISCLINHDRVAEAVNILTDTFEIA